MKEQIKQEAERIIDLFHIEIIDFNITDEVLENTAKQCALICIDEKIKTSEKTCSMFNIAGLTNSDLSCQPVQFYNQVKKYIEQNY